MSGWFSRTSPLRFHLAASALDTPPEAFLNNYLLKPMLLTPVVTPIQYFLFVRNLRQTAAICPPRMLVLKTRFAGYSAPDLANLSARRVYFVVPAWRCFLPFTTGIFSTGPHPTTASSSPLSSSENSRTAWLAAARANARSPSQMIAMRFKLTCRQKTYLK